MQFGARWGKHPLRRGCETSPSLMRSEGMKLQGLI